MEKATLKAVLTNYATHTFAKNIKPGIDRKFRLLF